MAVFLLVGGAALATGCKSPEPAPAAPDMASPAPPKCVAGCSLTVLTWCDEAGVPHTEDCKATLDNAGKPTTCQYFDDEDDYFCAGDFSGGCGDETVEGRCDGPRVIKCRSLESGDQPGQPDNVEITDCRMDPNGYTACAVAPDGTADCVKPGTKGCGLVPASGQCSGAVLTACVDSNVQTTDCAATGRRCGLMADNSGYGCISAGVFKTGAGDPTLAVSGKLVYEKLTVDTTSFSSAQAGLSTTPTLTPVRRAQVQMLDDQGTEIQRTFTEEDGSFTLYLPTLTTKARVLISTSGDPDRFPLAVRNCPPSPTDTFPAGCTDEVGQTHQWASQTFTGPTDLGQVVATEQSGLAGAFNIFNLLLRGQDFARVNLNDGKYPSTPPLSVQWRKGYETRTSYLGEQMVIQGVVTDTDEYDDTVLMHEFGHFLERAFSVSDSPGGFHNGSPTDPRLAFGEGYGTYTGCAIAGSSIYYDTSPSGATVTNINNVGKRASLTDLRGIKQLIGEYVVAEILWRLDRGTGGDTMGNGAVDALGSAPIFDVLGKYFKDNDKYNGEHGSTGRELVKFIDGLFCRDYYGTAAADTPIYKRVVTTDHDFPYDDFEHKIAPVKSCSP
ncbi:MAG TPA: hypothetical protein PLW65_07305 [Pseudomonadota bacterium]|nr:hypothetical protein [Pseudomonadota bacterium]